MATSKHVSCAVLLTLLLCGSLAASEPQSILLWPNGTPGSEGKNTEETVRISDEGDHVLSNVHHPSITPYLPSKDNSTRAAVIVVPGGGHLELWMDHEGYRVAQWLSDHGVAAFVLKYRLARAKGSTYTIEGNELGDIRRAMKRRNKANKYRILKERRRPHSAVASRRQSPAVTLMAARSGTDWGDELFRRR
jgi:endo-1,4-beta-xylanase